MIPYQFKEEIDDVGFFRFDKRWIENKSWALLPMASKAILPVIGCHCDANGFAFPGERRIAILAGLSDKTLRKGIQGLEGLPGFRSEPYVTSRLKNSKRFFLDLPPLERGRFFSFHKFILESGLWRELSAVAKAVYPVIRCYSWFDLILYRGFEEEAFYDPDNPAATFEKREYEFFDGDLSYIREYSGIHRNSLKSALSDLHIKALIEPHEENDSWRVYLRSKERRRYPCDYLNTEILKSYHHLLNKSVNSTRIKNDTTKALKDNSENIPF
jgi:hypothetical protein